MKLAILLLAAFALSPWCFAGVVSGIPPANQVTLNKVDYSYVSSTLSSNWMPSPDQVSEALPVIQAFLDQGSSGKSFAKLFAKNSVARRQFLTEQIAKIQANKAGYRVQCWGVTQNGTKLIFCNFFPASSGKKQENEFGKWKGEVILVDDGGYHFWQALYDPKTHKVVRFDCNGDA
jgi:hypothetical protein